MWLSRKLLSAPRCLVTSEAVLCIGLGQRGSGVGEGAEARKQGTRRWKATYSGGEPLKEPKMGGAHEEGALLLGVGPELAWPDSLRLHEA